MNSLDVLLAGLTVREVVEGVTAAIMRNAVELREVAQVLEEVAEQIRTGNAQVKAR